MKEELKQAEAYEAPKAEMLTIVPEGSTLQAQSAGPGEDLED